jgi:outer membrane lipoprotein-sorting protein
MVVARGGRLYLKGSVAIVTALELVANGDRFWFQVPSKKTVWTGRSDSAPDAERGDAPYYALRPRDIVLAFLPEPLEPREGEWLLFESDRQDFSMTLAATSAGAGYVRRRVSLVRESLAWQRSREFDEHGELQNEIRVADFVDGLPRHVVITRPTQGYVASFALDKVERNASVPERAFTGRAPEGYTVVEVP